MQQNLQRGCVVYMKSDSGMKGYGNEQCVSWVSHELGELSLFGHNEHYKTHDVREVISYPTPSTPPLPAMEEGLKEDEIESAVNELSKLSTAPDKETPDWMKSDIRRGIVWAINRLSSNSSAEKQ